MNRAVRQRRQEQQQAQRDAHRAAMALAVQQSAQGHLFHPTLVDQILDVLNLANELAETLTRPAVDKHQLMNTQWLQGALWLLKTLVSQNSGAKKAAPIENRVYANKMKRRPDAGVNIWRKDFEFVEPGKPAKTKAKELSFSTSVYK